MQDEQRPEEEPGYTARPATMQDEQRPEEEPGYTARPGDRMPCVERTPPRRLPARQGSPSRTRSDRYRTTGQSVRLSVSRRRHASTTNIRSASRPPTAAPVHPRRAARHRSPGWPVRTPPRLTDRLVRAEDARWRLWAARRRTPARHAPLRGPRGQTWTPASPTGCQVTSSLIGPFSVVT